MYFFGLVLVILIDRSDHNDGRYSRGEKLLSGDIRTVRVDVEF